MTSIKSKEVLDKGIVDSVNYSISQMNITRKEKGQFLERFKDKINVMNKDGHLGVVASSSRPIQKIDKANVDNILLPPPEPSYPNNSAHIVKPKSYPAGLRNDRLSTETSDLMEGYFPVLSKYQNITPEKSLYRRKDLLSTLDERRNSSTGKKRKKKHRYDVQEFPLNSFDLRKSNSNYNNTEQLGSFINTIEQENEVAKMNPQLYLHLNNSGKAYFNQIAYHQILNNGGPHYMSVDKGMPEMVQSGPTTRKHNNSTNFNKSGRVNNFNGVPNDSKSKIPPPYPSNRKNKINQLSFENPYTVAEHNKKMGLGNPPLKTNSMQMHNSPKNPSPSNANYPGSIEPISKQPEYLYPSQGNPSATGMENMTKKNRGFLSPQGMRQYSNEELFKENKKQKKGNKVDLAYYQHRQSHDPFYEYNEIAQQKMLSVPPEKSTSVFPAMHKDLLHQYANSNFKRTKTPSGLQKSRQPRALDVNKSVDERLRLMEKNNKLKWKDEIKNSHGSKSGSLSPQRNPKYVAPMKLNGIQSDFENSKKQASSRLPQSVMMPAISTNEISSHQILNSNLQKSLKAQEKGSQFSTIDSKVGAKPTNPLALSGKQSLYNNGKLLSKREENLRSMDKLYEYTHNKKMSSARGLLNVNDSFEEAQCAELDQLTQQIDMKMKRFENMKISYPYENQQGYISLNNPYILHRDIKKSPSFGHIESFKKKKS